MAIPKLDISSDSWAVPFYALPPDSQHALCFLAIYTAPIQLTRLCEFCGCLGVQPDSRQGQNVYYYPTTLKKHAWTPSRLNKVLDILSKTGFVELPHGQAVCKPVLRERIIRHLVKSGQYKKYANIVVSLTRNQYYSRQSRQSTPDDAVREIRHDLIAGGADNLKRSLFFLFDHPDDSEYTAPILALFEGHDNWWSIASPEARSIFLQFRLVVALSELKPIPPELWPMLFETVDQPKCDPETQVLLLDYALCAGKLDEIRPDRLRGTMSRALLEAHKALLSGSYEKAADHYKKVRTSSPGLKNSRTKPLHYLSGIFSVLCDLHLGKTDQVRAVVQSALNRNTRIRDMTSFSLNLDEAWTVLRAIVVKLEGLAPDRLDLKKIDDATTGAQWLPLLLLGYETAWFSYDGRSALSERLLSLAMKERTDFPWIAAEASELAVSSGTGQGKAKRLLESTEVFRKSSGSVSLAGLLAPKSDWEICLDSLRSLTEPETGSGSSTAEAKGSRLVWRATFVEQRTSVGFRASFEPYEQIRSPKKQTWSQGRAIALSRLHSSSNTLDFLTEQDRRAVLHIEPYVYGSYYKKTQYATENTMAMELVGHPLIFLAKDPAVRVELFEAKPELTVEKSGGSIHVSFSPPLRQFEQYGGGLADDSGNDLFILEETKTRYKVVSLSKKEQKIRQVLGPDGKTFPLEAEASLTAMLGNLLGDVTVKTDAKIEFENVPEVPAQTKSYLHLAPNGEGLQAEFFVRPLGPEGPAHRPGSGSERVIGEVDGRNIQSLRDLAGETKRRDGIVARYPAFENAAALSKDQYLFGTANDALAFLSELEDYRHESGKNGSGKGKKRSIQSDELEILWPQGGNISVSGSASFGNLNLSFASAEEWLSATGTLKVDKEVLELQKLLELLDEDSESRFVKISDRKFLALTNEFRKRLGDLKRLSHAKGKQVQIHPLAAVGMEDFFDAVPSLRKSGLWKDVRKRIETVRNFDPVLPKDFRGDLRDYQVEGFRWLARYAEWGVGCCLADDMGLGKTVQALALLLQRASKGPALIVAPTSVCFNWEREAERFAPTLRIRRIQSLGPGNTVTKKDRDEQILSAKTRDVVITSYNLLQQEIGLFEKTGFATVILDEAQAIKNPESNRAKAATRLQAAFRLGMTGTPIENNLVELWSLFRFLDPGLLGSQKSFEDRFAHPIQRDHAPGPRNTLRRLMQPLILRRTKSQVLEELPPRTEIIRDIELSREESALYEAARLNALSELTESKNLNSGKGRLQILAALTRLRQLCCNPKMIIPDSKVESSKLEAFREIMWDLKENRHRVLVFSQFVKHLALLKSELDDMGMSYQYLDGSTPARERQKRVDAFQSGESDAFLISIKAGGSGLNLTAADYVIHMDPWWNPAVEDQATDRTHRIGQTRPVTVYRLIARGTIEEKIVRLHHEKRDIADKLLEGSDQASKLTAEELIDILRS